MYTNKAVSKAINFFHNYYLLEDDGIKPIDIFIDDSDHPTIIYEVTSVEKKPLTTGFYMERNSPVRNTHQWSKKK